MSQIRNRKSGNCPNIIDSYLCMDSQKCMSIVMRQAFHPWRKVLVWFSLKSRPGEWYSHPQRENCQCPQQRGVHINTMTKFSCIFLTNSSLQGPKEILCHRGGVESFKSMLFKMWALKYFQCPHNRCLRTLWCCWELRGILVCLDVVIKSDGLDNP